MSDTWSPQQRVIEKQLASLKTVIGTEETVRWFSSEAYSRGLIDSHVHKGSNEVGHSAAAKAGAVWDALLNRMKTGDSENTFQSILDIFNKEMATQYVVEKLKVALSLELQCYNSEHNKPASVRSDGASKCWRYSIPDKNDLNASTCTRSVDHNSEALPKNMVDNSQAFPSQHDENGTGSKSSIQEEQSSASAQLVTPQEAQVSYDNFDRAIEQIKLAQIAGAAKDEEMKELKSKYDEKCKEVQKLTSELEESRQEKQQLCKKICQLETEAKEYKIKVDNLETEVGDLKSRVKTLEESIKDKEVEKERLLKEKAMMETELWKKKHELSESVAEKERLKREAAENQSRIAVFQAREEVEIERLKREAAEEEVEKIRRQSFGAVESLQRQFSQQSLSKDEEVKTLQKQGTDKDLEIQQLREELQVLKSQSH